VVEQRDDVFEFHQPRTRLEDLVIQLGTETGFVGVDREGERIRPEDLSVRFSLRRVEILLPFASETGGGGGGGRTFPRLVRKPIVGTQRARDESLEDTAGKLLEVLSRTVLHRIDSGRRTWYTKV
jgi:hypothetical protein